MRVFDSGGRENLGRFWCRQCQKSGDFYSWKIDIEGKRPVEVLGHSGKLVTRKPVQEKKTEPFDWPMFRGFAKAVCEAAIDHRNDAEAREFFLSARGLTEQTVERLHFGWVPKDCFFPASQTGKSDGRYICLPQGACLPVMGDKGIEALLIRRSDASRKAMCKKAGVEDDGKRFKWCEIGRHGASFLQGVKGRPLAVCESILDCASIYQCKQGFLSSCAFLGASKGPDEKAAQWIKEAERVLVCADSDQGGEALIETVLELRPDALPWRPIGDGIGDVNEALCKLGDVNTALWLDYGLAQTFTDTDAF